ncbi:MAG: ABC transporter permease [Clostridia bacterium]|nr:ABC transporter permease [Clostridia bacterium]
MSIFQKVTLKTLGKNKVRTAVTIIGVLLATAMICAVTTIASSTINYTKENYEYMDGSWHGSVWDADKQTIDKLNASDKVDKIVYGQSIGYADANSVNPDKPYLYILGASQNFEDMMPVHLTAGEYPQNQNEILLPEHLLSNGGATHKIGDVLTLQIGDRGEIGSGLSQQTPYMGEELAIRETRTYKVVGFYSRPGFEALTAPGYTAITLADADTGNSLCDVYFTMKNVKDISAFGKETGLDVVKNSDVLMFSGVSEQSSFFTIIYGLAGVIIALIVFGAVALIYNSFAISVSERTKQFGLLSSVGATRRQLRHMVIFEALAVSAIGIPLGILSGVGGIGIVLALFGDKFTAFTSLPLPMTLSINPWGIIAAAVIALITVLISAWIPSIRAMRVSAVEAIRQNADIKAKKSRTSKLTYKLFGLPGVLASKHFKRNRKKYRATVLSLFMSIVLFISAFALSDYLTKTAESAFSSASYDITYSGFDRSNPNLSADKLLSQIRGADKVKNATYTTYYKLGTSVKTSVLDPQWLDDAAGSVTYVEGLPADQSHTVIHYAFVEDETYRAYLKEQGLDEQKYMSTTAPVAVALDGNTMYNRTEEKYETINMLAGKPNELAVTAVKDIEGYYFDSIAGDHYRYVSYLGDEDVLLPKSEAAVTKTLQIGTVLYEKPYFIYEDMFLTLMYPQSALPAVFPTMQESGTTEYLIVSDDHTKSFEAVRELLIDNGLATDELFNYAAAVQRNRDIVTIIRVFAYGFIALISLIAAANVFNTITTNVQLRRREFAMLKSVGMTKRDFTRMTCFECLLYGAKALLWGLPVSVLVTFIIYLIVSEGVTLGFTLPWAAIGIAVASVFLVVFVTMMYAMHKIHKDNPIDALKNDNL